MTLVCAGLDAVDGVATDGEGGFFHRFTECGVGVDGAAEVFGAAAIFHMADGGGDEFGAAFGDDLDAEEAVSCRVGDDFDKSVGGIGSDGASVGGKVEFSGFGFDLLFFGGGFGEADAGDFRLGIDDVGNDVVVYMTGLSGDAFDAGDAFFFGFVGEHGSGDDIADGVDAGDVGLEVLVDRDASFFVGFESGFFEPESFGEGLAADGNENFIGFDLDGFAFFVFGLEIGFSGVLFEAGYFCAEVEVKILFFEEALGHLGDVFVEGGGDDGEEFDDVDLCAEAGPDGAEFEANGSGADDDEPLGNCIEGDGLGAADDGFTIEGQEGELNRHGAGREYDVLGFEEGFSGVSGDADFALAFEHTESLQDGYLVGLHELGDATAELADGAFFAGHEFADIDGEVGQVDAVIGGTMTGKVKHLGGVEECLAGNAADVEASAAEGFVFFDEGGFEAELGSANGGDVTAGAGAEDDEIELEGF